MDIRKLLTRYHTITFVQLPVGVYADCDLGTSEIRIDLRKNTNPVRSYIHELCHLSFPRLSESEILSMERKHWRKSTKLDRLLFYQTLFWTKKKGG